MIARRLNCRARHGRALALKRAPGRWACSRCGETWTLRAGRRLGCALTARRAVAALLAAAVIAFALIPAARLLG